MFERRTLSGAVARVPILAASQPVQPDDEPEDEADPAQEHDGEHHSRSPFAKITTMPMSPNQAAIPTNASANE